MEKNQKENVYLCVYIWESERVSRVWFFVAP